MGYVILASALTPDIALQAVVESASAVLTRSGGSTCHGAILLRQHAIPCVSDLSQLDSIPEGATVMVNGGKGEVTWSI